LFHSRYHQQISIIYEKSALEKENNHRKLLENLNLNFYRDVPFVTSVNTINAARDVHISEGARDGCH